MRTDEELLQALRRALAPGAGADQARVTALVAAAAALPPAGPAAPGRTRPARWVAAAAVAVVLVAGGAVVGAAGDAPDEGTAEFAAELARDAGVVAEVDGRLVPFGRVVELRSDDLPVLPKGEFYEVWFVAEEPAGNAPARISAGTFHPDARGRTDVSLFAAVDPRRYPLIAVTAEPDGVEVLRGRVRLL